MSAWPEMSWLIHLALKLGQFFVGKYGPRLKLVRREKSEVQMGCRNLPAAIETSSLDV